MSDFRFQPPSAPISHRIPPCVDTAIEQKLEGDFRFTHVSFIVYYP
jgi:hypothetical protein